MKISCSARPAFHPRRRHIGLPAFIAALRSAGYGGYLCAELSWDYTVNPDTAARKTALRLRDMIGKG